jgi:hypothetical protein
MVFPPPLTNNTLDRGLVCHAALNWFDTGSVLGRSAIDGRAARHPGYVCS